MDPRHDPDLILGHLEGDLSPEDAAKVQALQEADPDFAALLCGMENDRVQLRTAPAAPPPAGLADAALADLERSMLLDAPGDDGLVALPPGRRRLALAPLLTYGAVAAVLALTASAVFQSVSPPTPSPPIAAAPSTDGFDIAAAPIQAQRELARQDQADVDFSAETAASPSAESRQTAAADRHTIDPTSPASHFAAPPPSAQTKQTTNSAPPGSPSPATLAAAEPPPAPEGLQAAKRARRAKPSALAAMARAELGPSDPIDAPAATDEPQLPAPPSPAALSAPDPTPPITAPPAPARSRAAAPAAKSGAEPAAPSAPQSVPPAWLSPLDTLGTDWTRWIRLSTLPAEENRPGPTP